MSEPSHDPHAAELASVLARLRTLEDRCAIAEHTAFYNQCWDDGRLDEWVATFTEDGVFELAGAPDTVGPEALHKMITAMTSVGFVHMTLNQQIRVDGDEATQECTVLLGRRSPKREPDSSRWVTTGSYRDNLRRRPEGWLFTRRVFAPDASLRGLPRWW